MSPSYRHHGSHGDLLRQDGDMGPGDEFQTPTGARWATRLELCAAGVAGRGRLVSSGKARNDGRIVKTAHRTISSSCLNRRMSGHELQRRRGLRFVFMVQLVGLPCASIAFGTDVSK